MAESYRTNLVNIAAAYAKVLNVKVTRTTLKETLTAHPWYPSLYSLSDTFEKLNIAHTTFKIDKENIDSLATPFIAYMDHQSTGKDFVTVTSMTNDDVSYYAENKRPKRISKEEFLKNWMGIVLEAAPDAGSGEKDYLQKRKAEQANSNRKYALIIAAIAVLLVAVYSFLSSTQAVMLLPAVLLLLIKATGLTAAVLLLVYETDKTNTFVKNICTAGRHTNCDAVLGSKAAKVLGMSWSEAGFFYFASTFLFLLIPFYEFSIKATILAGANLLAAPYVFFSIYYQWKVVRQWCPLCLTVQGVLLAELVWSMLNVWMAHPAIPLAQMILPVVLCIAIPAVLWFAVKPLLASHKEAPMYKAAYKRLLYNPDTFHQLLWQQPPAPEGYEGLGITIGNPNAENTIIKVCNPYCGPCARAHTVIHKILNKNQNIKLRIIFSALTDESKKIVKYFLSINKNEKEETLRNVLDDWYFSAKKDYDSFTAKYPIDINGDLDSEIEKMNRWYNKAEINGTPSFFINGRKLPQAYNFYELEYLF